MYFCIKPLCDRCRGGWHYRQS
uniref:Uncharacterized protein n=1 Tax=Anguilla anguilla TaxID=7936 RepID=A0A0E9SSG1_ANGAN